MRPTGSLRSRWIFFIIRSRVTQTSRSFSRILRNSDSRSRILHGEILYRSTSTMRKRHTIRTSLISSLRSITTRLMMMTDCATTRWFMTAKSRFIASLTPRSNTTRCSSITSPDLSARYCLSWTFIRLTRYRMLRIISSCARISTGITTACANMRRRELLWASRHLITATRRPRNHSIIW